MHLELPSRRIDLTGGALTVGVVPVRGVTQPADHLAGATDALVGAAEALVASGADAVDLGCDDPAAGGVATGVADTGWLGEIIGALGERVNVPVGVEVAEPSMVDACSLAGAAWVADPSGAYSPDYLAACAEAGVAVRVIRCPSVLDTSSVGRRDYSATDGFVDAAQRWFRKIAATATLAGVSPGALMVDPCSGPTVPDANVLRLVAAAPQLSGLGHVVALSPDALGETRSGEAPHDGSCTAPSPALLAGMAVGVALGCRVIRSGHVRSARRVFAVMDAVAERR